MKSTKYDVVIVGAGIAGPAIAYALSASSRLRQTLSKENQRTKPLRILLIDSKLAKPNRIVGEFLQPGGVHALEKIGLEGALEGIDAIRTLGYCILRPKPSSSTAEDGRTEFEKVHIPYPPGEAGRSFHHGEFVHSLRQHASRAEGVTLLEGTVKSEGVVYCPHTGRVLGVRVKSSSDPTAEEQVYLAKLTIFATGSSAFRRALYLPSSSSSEGGSTQQVTRNLETKTLGTFFGLILPNPPDKKYILPLYEHGCVILIPNSAGPVLLYQVGTNDTRILIDIPHDSPYKRDVQSYIRNVLLPNLPTEDLRRGLQTLVDEADNDEKRAGRLDLKGVANPFFPAPPQGGGRMREGALLLGDAWNQRHPLTGGGMTVAFGDVVTLASELILAEKQLFGEPSDKEVSSSNGIKVEETEVSLSEHDEEWTLGDWRVMDDIFDRWWWTRRGYASTINILSVALYDLFGGSSTNLEALQTGCFKYLGLGGECTNGPVTLLGGIAPRPFLLFRHFFTVAFYSLWVMFMHERPVLADEDSEEYSNGHAAHENGHSNGHANGHSNGHATAYANGHSNGLKKRHANGTNGHANGDSKAVARTVVKMARPSVLQWPLLFFRSFAVFWTACVVFGPLMWTEIKWW